MDINLESDQEFITDNYIFLKGSLWKYLLSCLQGSIHQGRVGQQIGGSILNFRSSTPKKLLSSRLNKLKLPF